MQEGDVRHHANGVTGVAAMTIAVRDIEASLKRYGALLGSGEAGPIGSGTVRGAPARTAILTLGNGTVVTLASPSGSGGDLAAHLEARGQGPFEVAFRSPTPKGDLDAALTHGARLSIVSG